MRVRGIELAVREQGRGTPFFWGHGLMGSMDQDDAADLFDWDEIASANRLLRYDARGHGRSEATLDPRGYRWPEMARDLWSLADACNAPTAVIGGLSMGCGTALHAAVEAPQRVLGLVLAAPPTAWQTRPRQSWIYRGMATCIAYLGLGPIRCAARLGRFAPAPEYLAKLKDSVMSSLDRADARSIVAALRGAAASDLPSLDALSSVKAPALILAWRGDPTHPLVTAEALADAMPGADLRVAKSLAEVRGWSRTIGGFLSDLDKDPGTNLGKHLDEQRDEDLEGATPPVGTLPA